MQVKMLQQIDERMEYDCERQACKYQGEALLRIMLCY